MQQHKAAAIGKSRLLAEKRKLAFLDLTWSTTVNDTPSSLTAPGIVIVQKIKFKTVKAEV